MNSRSAFTLVEIAIVLVIIGLIIGGVLAGRELITAARVRAQVAQIEEYNTAVTAFKLKYNCSPGDCASASSFGLGTDGNGNGSLENFRGEPLAVIYGVRGIELKYFWEHLGNSKLIAGTYTSGNTPGINSPALKLPGKVSGGMWVSDSYVVAQDPNALANLNKPAWLILSNTAYEGLLVANSVYSHANAFALDSKMDDGFPMKGFMIAMNGQSINNCSSSETYCVSQASSTTSTSPYQPGAATSCIDDSSGTALYNMLSDNCTNSTDLTCLCGLIIYNRP